jgi:DNA-binding transcriptional MerR regulator
MARADEELGGAAQRLAGGASGLNAGLTIARAAAAVGLARSTLMHYERLGLIKPLRRAGSRYRTFRPDDLQALFLIARWRSIGLPLATIRRLLAHPAEVTAALRDHLRTLDRSLDALQGQRRLTLEMLGRGAGADGAAPVTKAAWTAMFRSIGMSDAQMRAWHALFERRNGAGHADFLRSLGIGAAEIGRIRKWCVGPAKDQTGRGR